jgi:hypothetical protein
MAAVKLFTKKVWCRREEKSAQPFDCALFRATVSLAA